MTAGGLLVALEGGPGASTGSQAALLRSALDAAGVPVYLTDSDQSCIRADTLRAVEQRSYAGRLTPWLCRLARTADVAARQIVPQLETGQVVVVDRYRLTLFAHGIARGLDGAWLESVSEPLPRAHLSLYLRAAPDRQLRRLLDAAQALDGWETGADLARAAGVAAAFRAYQTRIGHAFDAIGQRWRLETVDADGAEAELGARIRERVLAALEGSA